MIDILSCGEKEIICFEEIYLRAFVNSFISSSGFQNTYLLLNCQNLVIFRMHLQGSVLKIKFLIQNLSLLHENKRYYVISLQFSSVQLLSRVQLFVTTWTAVQQASLSITNSWSLLKLMSIKQVMPSNHLILSFPSSPAFNLSQHQGLFSESALHIMWPKYWSFSFNISPSNEYSGLISFRIDWLDLLAALFMNKRVNI